MLGDQVTVGIKAKNWMCVEAWFCQIRSHILYLLFLVDVFNIIITFSFYPFYLQLTHELHSFTPVALHVQ